MSEKEYSAVLFRLREQTKYRLADAQAAGKPREAEFWARDLRKFEKIIARRAVAPAKE